MGIVQDWVPSWISDANGTLYFHGKEIDRFKQSLSAVSHSVTALSNSVNIVKADASLAVASAQLFKADFSMVKWDEKGLTVAGRTVRPWAGIQAGEDAKKNKDKADLAAKFTAVDDKIKNLSLVYVSKEDLKELKDLGEESKKKAAGANSAMTRQGSKKKGGNKPPSGEEFRRVEGDVKRLTNAVNILVKSLG